MEQQQTTDIKPIVIAQDVAILIDGNNIERSLSSLIGKNQVFLNFDKVIPRLLDGRGLSRLIYFREGVKISKKPMLFLVSEAQS